MRHHVLLVEDDEVDVMMIQRAFEKSNKGHLLHIASDGEEALEILSKGKIPHPFLVLLDINMPRMNGLEFLGLLRENHNLKNIAVIILSSSRREDDVCGAYNKHVAGYFIKPINGKQLEEMMNVISTYWDGSERGLNCPPELE